MSPGKPKLQLGESWVVEGEDESPEYSPIETPPKKISPRRGARLNQRSLEPEFVMPPLDSDTLDASWADSSNRSPRYQRTPQSKEKETRRRVQQTSHGMPERSNRTKAGSKTYQGSAHLPESSQFQGVMTAVMHHTGAMLSHLLDIFFGALSVLKRPISWLLALWILIGIGLVLRNLFVTSLYASISPICRIPGSSLLNLPFCPIDGGYASQGPPPPVEFDQLMSVQSKFEEVLEETAGGASLPLDMKRSEASIRDLSQLVRYSQLQSRNELVLEFDGFIDTARIASYDLQKFNSHVGRAIDSVISTTRWTSRVLDSIQEQEASRGAISAFVTDKVLGFWQPIRFTEKTLLDQYIQHTHIVEEEIKRLISEAQALLMVLNNLEGRLDIIHGIATRDGMHAKAIKEDILWELWTLLGGNRGKLEKMKGQLDLLKQVKIYRQTAWAHVSGTILRLQAIGAGLEDLRERVAAPELLRDRTHIPLSVHIDNIERGVERLEEGRSRARMLETQHIKQSLDDGNQDGHFLEG